MAVILHAEHALTLLDRLELARLAGGGDVRAKLSAELEAVRLRGIEVQKRIATSSGVPCDGILLEFGDNSINVWHDG